MTTEMVNAYIDLCVDHGYDGNAWGDQNTTIATNHFDNPVDLDDKPIVLIEHSKYGQVWITLHPTLETACNANVNQEYADDWLYPTIVDIRTGRHYEVEYRAVAVPIKEGAST